MLLHVAKTRTLKRFSKTRHHHQNPSKEPVPDNMVSFPSPDVQSSTEDKEQVELDWETRLITKKQLWYIQLLAKQKGLTVETLNKQCFMLYGADLSTMRRIDASDTIQFLKQSLRQEYKPFH